MEYPLEAPALPPSSFLEPAASFNVTDAQFLGQRGDSGGGDAVRAAEAAGHHVPDDDVDLPFGPNQSA